MIFITNLILVACLGLITPSLQTTTTIIKNAQSQSTKTKDVTAGSQNEQLNERQLKLLKILKLNCIGIKDNNAGTMKSESNDKKADDKKPGGNVTQSNGTTSTVTGSNGTTNTVTGSNGTTSTVTGSNGTTSNVTGSNGTTSTVTGSNGTTSNVTGSNGTTSNVTGSNGTTSTVTGSNGTTSNVTGSNGTTSNATISKP